jgi:hypothetical protein
MAGYGWDRHAEGSRPRGRIVLDAKICRIALDGLDEEISLAAPD